MRQGGPDPIRLGLWPIHLPRPGEGSLSLPEGEGGARRASGGAALRKPRRGKAGPTPSVSAFGRSTFPGPGKDRFPFPKGRVAPEGRRVGLRVVSLDAARRPRPHPSRPSADPPSPVRGRIDFLPEREGGARRASGGADRRKPRSGKAGPTPSVSAFGRSTFPVSGKDRSPSPTVSALGRATFPSRGRIANVI